MAFVHYLNVRNGDCSIIQHNSGNVTVIDVSNAKPVNELLERTEIEFSIMEKGINGNFRQKDYLINPIAYLGRLKISRIFRFVATHPDMDHLDGIKCLFQLLHPLNFWDTDNHAEKLFTESRFKEDDWDFYKSLRDGKPQMDPKRLTLFSNARGKFWNVNDNGTEGGDGISVLAPNPVLLRDANDSDDYNDC